MWDEGEKEGGALIKSEPPCTLLYPQLSENLDRQTQGCWPYFDSLGNFKWLNHNFLSKKMPKKGLKTLKVRWNVSSSHVLTKVKSYNLTIYVAEKYFNGFLRVITK